MTEGKEVSKIEPIGNSRYKVYLAGEFAFVLYKGELSCYGIKEGTELSNETYTKIMDEVLPKRAKSKALHLLEGMARSEANLKQKLKQGYYPDAIIQQAIDYVKSFGYLDDYKFTRDFVESKISQKSRREMYRLLLTKGIERDIVETILDEYDQEEVEDEAIRQIIKRRRVELDTITFQERQKLYRYLSGKGFGYEAISRVLQEDTENT